MNNPHLEKYHGSLKFSEEGDQRMVFDPIRKKYYSVQPEELVRQSWIIYLTEARGISTASIGVEKQFKHNGLNRRFDLVIYRKGVPYALFEFKSFNKPVKSDAAYQVAYYNLGLNVPYIIISNGITHHAFEIDFDAKACQALSDLSFLDF